MLMHCSRLLRRGAVCALLLVVARLISSSLVLDSISPMQQYFRAVRGQSSVLDDNVNSSAVPVFPSVSSEMSETVLLVNLLMAAAPRLLLCLLLANWLPLLKVPSLKVV